MLKTGWFWMIVAIGLVAIGTIVLGFDRLRENAPRARAQAQQERVQELRAHTEICLEDLEGLEERFWDHERRTREIRAEIDSFESLDPDGVPVDRYQDYLDAVDRYNESLEVWEARIDSVETHQERCRDLSDRYEEERDAFRRFLLDEGLVDGEP